MTQAKRFGWQTKRDIRLRLLRDTLNKLNDNLIAELAREQQQREVRAERVLMDAYTAAKKTDKNAWADVNAALQRNGFKRLDVQHSRGMNNRARDVRETEAALLKRFKLRSRSIHGLAKVMTLNALYKYLYLLHSMLMIIVVGLLCFNL